MKIDLTILSKTQLNRLQKLVATIVGKMALSHIICTGIRKEKFQHRSFHQMSESTNICQLELLLIYQDKAYPDSSNSPKPMDDFSSEHFTCTFSCYKLSHAKELLQENDYYLHSAMRYGALLFQQNVLLPQKKEYTNSKAAIDTISTCWTRWYVKACKFMDCALYCVAEGNFDMAAFMTHQTVEHTCKAMLRSFARTCPQTHNLNYLLKRCASFHPDIPKIFPKSCPEDNKLMKQLRQSYIDCRYSACFEVKQEAIWTMIERASQLLQLAGELYNQQRELLRQTVANTIQ